MSIIKAPAFFSNEEKLFPETKDKKGGVQVGPDKSPQLEAVAQCLQSHPGVKLRLDGYANGTGPDDGDKFNKALSQRRVEAVVKYLLDIDRGFEGRLLHDPSSYHGSKDLRFQPPEDVRNRAVFFTIVPTEGEK